MVAEGAVIELGPQRGCARGKNSSYMTNPGNWVNWLTESIVTYHAAGPAFTTWAIDFGARERSTARNIGSTPTDRALLTASPPAPHSIFALITEPWSAATPDPNRFGPRLRDDHRRSKSNPRAGYRNCRRPGCEHHSDTADPGKRIPQHYYGVRFFVSAGVTSLRGGVVAPGGAVTGNLILDQAATPEPASLAVLGVGGALLLRRRPR